MDRQARIDLIKLWLEKARDDLATAEDDLKLNHTRGVVNRSYYGIFHAATAALLWHGEERVKHSGVQSTFGELFITTGIFEPDLGRIYTRARKEREEVDYKPASPAPTPEQASTRLDESHRFVARIEQYLREVGAIE